jgi:hypothetical protein
LGNPIHGCYVPRLDTGTAEVFYVCQDVTSFGALVYEIEPRVLRPVSPSDDDQYYAEKNGGECTVFVMHMLDHGHSSRNREIDSCLTINKTVH